MHLADQHLDWVLGVVDETWWRRLAHPPLHAWTEQSPLQLVQQAFAKDDPDPKALCCYGLLRTDCQQAFLRFVEGCSVSDVPTAFLAWLVQQLAAEQKEGLVLI
jgi:hypothetical protein